MTTPLVVHGHFYQPPRENPWTGTIDPQPSAYPFANWNERIYRECYRPNALARVLNHNAQIEDIVSSYKQISFNFGPTLLSWLEKEHPDTYLKILEADRESLKQRQGHGNALAQAYNHSILPLNTPRDRRTQIRWGIVDFFSRFNRKPEGMWLPEAACNEATLKDLIHEGIRFIILAPTQVDKVRKFGDKKWHDVSKGNVDTGQAYRFFHPDRSGRCIDFFFYDGPTAQKIAFGGILRSSQDLVDQFLKVPGGERRLVHVATDGESYGHHFKFGELSLAYALEVEAVKRGFFVTNYGEYLEQYPPKYEVKIKPGPQGEGTSWSCAHGVGRWIRDCGCETGGREGWNQKWRAPLRQALDRLHGASAIQFEQEGRKFFDDPWATRDAYIDLILGLVNPSEWLFEQSGQYLTGSHQARALAHMEIQRYTMLMYTSCGWFFSDISGIETLQILKYAARALELTEEIRLPSIREEFLDLLSQAKSNFNRFGNGADIFEKQVEGQKYLRRNRAYSFPPLSPYEKEETAITDQVLLVVKNPNSRNIEKAIDLIQSSKGNGAGPNLHEAQDIFFQMKGQIHIHPQLKILSALLGFSPKAMSKK